MQAIDTTVSKNEPQLKPSPQPQLPQQPIDYASPSTVQAQAKAEPPAGMPENPPAYFRLVNMNGPFSHGFRFGLGFWLAGLVVSLAVVLFFFAMGGFFGWAITHR